MAASSNDSRDDGETLMPIDTIEDAQADQSSGTVGVSCKVCKQRKVKCDREQPTCGPCAKSKHTCEYEAKKKPGLRAGYGRELEARLDRLEAHIVTQQNVIQQLCGQILNVQSSITAVQSVQQGQAMHSVSAQPSPADGASPHALQPAAQSYHSIRSGLSVGGPSPRGLDNHSLSGSQTARLADRGMNNGVQSWTTSAASPSAQAMAGSAAQDGLLPIDLLYALTELFFKHINPWCPILHRESAVSGLFGTQALEEGDYMILHAIAVTSMKFSNDQRLQDEAVRQSIRTASKHKILLFGLENVSIKALQALAILALDVLGDANGPPGWNVLALITRNAVRIGLSIEQTSSLIAPLSPSIYTLRAVVLPAAQTITEDESRRRLFWSIYILDRYATISTAFDFGILDKDIDRRLPCRDELMATATTPIDTSWLNPSSPERHGPGDHTRMQNTGAFGYYIQLLDILTQIHLFLKTPVDIGERRDVAEWQRQYLALDSRLSAWRNGLPGEFGNLSRLFNPGLYREPVDCMWIMLQCTYFTTVVRLHSSAAYPATRSQAFQPSFFASQRCLSAVDDICALCSYITEHNMLQHLGPPFAFSVWVAARVLLVAGSMAQNISPAIHSLVETLSKLGTYWKSAERYATLLRRVLDEYQEAQTSPSATGEPPSSMQIVSDMRRCAYDLDYLISAQPRYQAGPTRTAALLEQPNNVPYDLSLDMFGFFNMPRLATNHDGDAGLEQGMDAQYQANFDYQNLGAEGWSDWVVQ